ncbi:flavodoxin domain-containing protein [Secundilactobacillus kimchicus]|uniref:flavodoxin domain-containing protein n=1 Tax=Secundilactobacillus kimchicus TaxID=528209 RepID=UPI0024A903F0|nr:flavodoxin domain-containing protein [Secundilactobacillus kimchicus]
MTKIAIYYASLTGNNEEVAEFLATEFARYGLKAPLANLESVTVDDLAALDLAIIVPYTYGEGDLPEEGIDLFNDLETIKLPHLIFGVAGSGDTCYGATFCQAVNRFNTRLASTGAIQGSRPVCIDLRIDHQNCVALKGFVADLIQTLKEADTGEKAPHFN